MLFFFFKVECVSGETVLCDSVKELLKKVFRNIGEEKKWLNKKLDFRSLATYTDKTSKA